jgi:hypothetical protein
LNFTAQVSLAGTSAKLGVWSPHQTEKDLGQDFEQKIFDPIMVSTRVLEGFHDGANLPRKRSKDENLRWF